MIDNKNKEHYKRDSCRLCLNKNVELILAMPATPIGDHYVEKANSKIEQTRYPMDIYFCHECGHVQMLDVVSPDLIYSDYLYETANSLGLVEHFKKYANEIVNSWDVSKGSLIVDIGCNDGSFLSAMKGLGQRVIGVEPAIAIANRNNLNGIETYPTFFSSELADKIYNEHGKAAIITANNVMANIDDLDEFADGVRNLLADNGLFIFESGYLIDTINNSVLDNIYHEHISYYKANPLLKYFDKHGLELIDIKYSNTKGGSIRGVVQIKAGKWSVNESVSELSKKETESGYDNIGVYKKFSEKMSVNKRHLLKVLSSFNKENVVGFGASVGVTTLIYYFDLTDKINFLIDDNEKRHGLISPGCHLRVLKPDEIYKSDIEAIVLFAWRYEKPILERHKQFNGSFKILIPLPELQFIKY